MHSSLKKVATGSVVAIQLSFLTPLAAAQSLGDEDLAAFGKAVAEAKAAMKAAMQDASEGDAQYEARAATRKLQIQNSMRQIASSPDRDLGNKLPLPDFIGHAEIKEVLGYAAAWQTPWQANAKNEIVKAALGELAFVSGRLLYFEWSCATGAADAVGRQTIDLLPQLVTSYTERLLLRAALNDRKLLGYPNSSRCDQDALHRHRRKYQELLGLILEQEELALLGG